MKVSSVLLIFILFATAVFAQDYYRISGKVVDSEHKNPLVFAAVYISGNQYKGTAANDSGEFVLKIATNETVDTIKFSYVGYKTKAIFLGKVNTDKNLGIISLEESTLQLSEVVVTPLNPQELIDKAIEQIPVNYDIQPIMLTGFYQEVQGIKTLDFKTENFTNEVYEKEAVFEIYRSPYKTDAAKEAADDYIKLLAWRKSGEIKDTVFQSAMGGMKGSGPNAILNNDPLKDIKSSFLWPRNRKSYVFTLKEITQYDNLNVYVLEFDQADDVKEQLFKGTIYIDMESLAFVMLDYSLSPKGARFSSPVKFMFMGFKIIQQTKKIIYRKYNDKWNIYFAENKGRANMTFYNTFMTKKWFAKNAPGKETANFSIDLNNKFVITDTEKNKVVKFSGNELFKSTTELKTEKNKNNDDIWGKHNYIKTR